LEDIVPPAFILRPLKNAPVCPIPALGSNFNPRNTQCIPVVKIFAYLGLKQNLTFFKGLILMRLTVAKCSVSKQLNECAAFNSY